MTHFTIKRILNGLLCHYSQEGNILATEHYRIWRSVNNGKAWRKFAQAPVSPFRVLLSHFQPFRRALRLGIHNLLILKNGDVLAIADGLIFHSDGRDSGMRIVHKLRRGRSSLSKGICITEGGSIYFGEYWPNSKREKVLLWRSRDSGLSWEIAYIFPKETIQHIHSVQEDPFTGWLWLTTGDHGYECRIQYSDDGGNTFNAIGVGGQHLRAVSLMFTPTHVVWGSDAGMDAPGFSNHFCSWNREKGTIEKLADVDGPVYYSTQLSDGFYLAGTTVEGGNNELDEKAHLWISKDGLEWLDIHEWQKDFYPPIMGYGVLLFPKGEVFSNNIYLSGIGLQDLDNATIIATLNN